MKTLAETFLEAVTAAYPEDPSTPGIVVSFLGRERGYYVSLVRYSDPGGDGKRVMLRATRPSLDAALTECARKWFVKYAPAEAAIRSLKKALRERGPISISGRKSVHANAVHAEEAYDYNDPDPWNDAAEEMTWD